MSVRWSNIVFDCSDARRVAAFWSGVFDRPVQGPEQASDGSLELWIEPGGEIPDILFIEVPEPKQVKNRLHLDIRGENRDAEVHRLEALGARRVDIGQGDVTWVVMADPEGNEFCVLREQPE